MQPNLLNEIEVFLETHGLSATAFGEMALGDRHFVKQLRGRPGKKPRRVWPETADKVRCFMVSYKPQQEAA
jgi:hypothetical protein